MSDLNGLDNTHLIGSRAEILQIGCELDDASQERQCYLLAEAGMLAVAEAVDLGLGPVVVELGRIIYFFRITGGTRLETSQWKALYRG